MSEHLNQNQIEDYAQQKLSPAELLPLSDHLSACEACRREVEDALGSDPTFFALRSEAFGAEAENVSSATRTHPASEHIAEYVDGTLAGDELQVLKDHFTVCVQCSMAVDDLRAFRDEIAPKLEREYSPTPGRTKRESRRHRLVGLLPSAFPKPRALAFGSAVVLLLLTATVWLVWRGEQKESNKELALATPSPISQPTPTTNMTPTASPTAVPEETPAPLVAQLNDGGGRVTLGGEGELSGVDQLPPAYQRMLKESLTSVHLERSTLLAGLTRASSPLMGSDEQGHKFSVIAPVGKVIQTNRPTFSWSPLAGTTAYVVEVYDEAFQPVATSPQLSKNSWTPPPLKRGGVYSWQVKAIKDGQEFSSPRPPAAQAKFRILDAARANELQQARRAYGSSHLLLGLLYARAGLLDEAEREFRALQKANPDSQLVRRLLSQVRK